jgi:hypothetical protein
MYELLIYVRHVKVRVVQRVRNHKNVEHVVEQEWKPLKQDHFLCVLLVEHVMAEVKQ